MLTITTLDHPSIQTDDMTIHSEQHSAPSTMMKYGISMAAIAMTSAAANALQLVLLDASVSGSDDDRINDESTTNCTAFSDVMQQTTQTDTNNNNITAMKESAVDGDLTEDQNLIVQQVQQLTSQSSHHTTLGIGAMIPVVTIPLLTSYRAVSSGDTTAQLNVKLTVEQPKTLHDDALSSSPNPASCCTSFPMTATAAATSSDFTATVPTTAATRGSNFTRYTSTYRQNSENTAKSDDEQTTQPKTNNFAPISNRGETTATTSDCRDHHKPKIRNLQKIMQLVKLSPKSRRKNEKCEWCVAHQQPASGDTDATDRALLIVDKPHDDLHNQRTKLKSKFAQSLSSLAEKTFSRADFEHSQNVSISMASMQLQDGKFTGEYPVTDTLPSGDIYIRVGLNYQIDMFVITGSGCQCTGRDERNNVHMSYFRTINIPIYVDPHTVDVTFDAIELRFTVVAHMKGLGRFGKLRSISVENLL